MPKIANMKYRIFKKPDFKWKSLTSKSRMCCENELDDVDFVYGPMVSNANAVSHGAIPKTHKPSSMFWPAIYDIYCTCPISSVEKNINTILNSRDCTDQCIKCLKLGLASRDL